MRRLARFESLEEIPHKKGKVMLCEIEEMAHESDFVTDSWSARLLSSPHDWNGREGRLLSCFCSFSCFCWGDPESGAIAGGEDEVPLKAELLFPAAVTITANSGGGTQIPPTKINCGGIWGLMKLLFWVVVDGRLVCSLYFCNNNPHQ